MFLDAHMVCSCSRASSFLPVSLPLFSLHWSLSESCTILFSIFKLVTADEVALGGLLNSILWPGYRRDAPCWLSQVAWLQVEH